MLNADQLTNEIIKNLQSMNQTKKDSIPTQFEVWKSVSIGIIEHLTKNLEFTDSEGNIYKIR